MYALSRYTLYFLVYCFLGAIAETLFRWVSEGQLYGINGFLGLPIFPIYGFGALLVILVSRRINHPIALFFISIGLMTLLEFVAHWLIEIIFGVRIWDYSHKPFNLEGRISLDNSISFGVASLALVYIIHPKVTAAVKRLSKRVAIVLAAVTLVVLLADTILSVARWLA